MYPNSIGFIIYEWIIFNTYVCSSVEGLEDEIFLVLCILSCWCQRQQIQVCMKFQFFHHNEILLSTASLWVRLARVQCSKLWNKISSFSRNSEKLFKILKGNWVKTITSAVRYFRVEMSIRSALGRISINLWHHETRFAWEVNVMTNMIFIVMWSPNHSFVIVVIAVDSLFA